MYRDINYIFSGSMTRSAIVTVNALAPKIATSLSINVSPTSGNVPITINVISTLYDSAGNPLLGKPIIEYINGIWIGERYSGTPFSMYFTGAEAGIYNFQNKFAGDDAYLACDSPVVTVTLTAAPPTKIATSISINVSPASGTVPFTVSSNGRLIDVAGTPLNNKTINLYSNGIFVSSTTTAGSGDYVFNLNITATGTYQFQTEFPGDATYEGCTVHNGTQGLLETKPSLVVPLLVGGLLLVGAVWLLKS